MTIEQLEKLCDIRVELRDSRNNLSEVKSLRDKLTKGADGPVKTRYNVGDFLGDSKILALLTYSGENSNRYVTAFIEAVYNHMVAEWDKVISAMEDDVRKVEHEIEQL